MGKYGFNEKEIAKTITDMIDKDGFHKEVVTYGKPAPDPVLSGLAMGAYIGNADEVVFVVINVSERARVMIIPKSTVEDYEFDIGDQFESDETEIEATIWLDEINAAVGILEENPFPGIDEVFFYAYAVSHDPIPVVLDRTSLAFHFGK